MREVLYTEYSAHTPSITSTVTISTSDSQTCVVDLVLDTGSFVSILPYSTYACHFRTPFSRPTARHVTYLKAQILVVGCLSAKLSLHDRSDSAMFYIVDKRTPLMRIENNQVLPPNALPVPASPVPDFQYIVGETTDFEYAKNFIHHIRLDETITPVCQKMCCLTLFIVMCQRNEICNAAGVVERIDTSALVSPIDLTQKKRGKIRMCYKVIVVSFP